MKVQENSSGSNKFSATPSRSLLDGLVGAGVTKAMMGIAVAGYANTVGASLEETSLPGTCFLEHEWDVDGDRTFVLKVMVLGEYLSCCTSLSLMRTSVDGAHGCNGGRSTLRFMTPHDRSVGSGNLV